MNINIIKSILVLLMIGLFFALSTVLVIKNIKIFARGMAGFKRTWHIYVLTVATVLSVVCFGDYVYPFERNVEVVLFAELEVSKEYELAFPNQKFWHGAFDNRGIYTSSYFFDVSKKESDYGFEWPELDFDNYSYIFTYGQKIESLSYNVWDIVESPGYTRAKEGHIVFDEAFSPEKIYIYQIPGRLRIENDIKDNGWYSGKGYEEQMKEWYINDPQ